MTGDSWELARNAESQTLPWSRWVKEALHVICLYTTVWKTLKPRLRDGVPMAGRLQVSFINKSQVHGTSPILAQRLKDKTFKVHLWIAEWMIHGLGIKSILTRNHFSSSPANGPALVWLSELSAFKGQGPFGSITVQGPQTPEWVSERGMESTGPYCGNSKLLQWGCKKLW